MPVWRIGRFDFGTQGKLHAALHVDDGGKLVMNGRDVFTFSAGAVPQSIARVLALNGIALTDVDRVLLHQGSKFIVDTIAKRIGAAEKTEFCASAYGNTVSSSIPILLAETVRPTDRRVLLCGFGVGLTWASTVLERRTA
jgi:3-oxoacyl-[acyl-carrier-protein] synthase-3